MKSPFACFGPDELADYFRGVVRPIQLKMHSKLELFKKTLPGASSFAQVDVTSQVMRSRAVE